MPPKPAQKTPAQGQGQGLDLMSLSAQQLMQVKKQLDDELEHLNSSYSSLRGAQARFIECGRCIDSGIKNKEEGAPLLVPLTQSLYVPGNLKSNSTVLVDVGTGFYVEKTVDEAKKFYEAKNQEIGKNLKDLEGVLQGKSSNLRAIEEVLRMKMSQQQSQGNQSAAGQQGIAAAS